MLHSLSLTYARRNAASPLPYGKYPLALNAHVTTQQILIAQYAVYDASFYAMDRERTVVLYPMNQAVFAHAGFQPHLLA